ncbi:potassium channel subfamily K member 4-like [Rhincodon typus]|uniref:potassium channel subfamily K member 4-like n=1 Tax=Rhincodon typus TaxID=259920 RepID=UPI00202E0C50|nr:potassium channel subfamily K member 4-like [Rhincodon typus]
MKFPISCSREGAEADMELKPQSGGDSKRVYKVWYKPLVWFWILIGLAYFAAILSMIGDWLRVLSRRTRAEMGGLTTQAANWTANLTTEIKVTRQRLSLEIHDKAQRGGVALVQKASPEAQGSPRLDPGPRGWEEAEAEDEDSRPFDFLGEDLAFIDAEESDRLSGRPSPVPAVHRAKCRGHHKQPRRANGYLGRQEHPSQTRDTGDNI